MHLRARERESLSAVPACENLDKCVFVHYATVSVRLSEGDGERERERERDGREEGEGVEYGGG